MRRSGCVEGFNPAYVEWVCLGIKFSIFIDQIGDQTELN